MLSADRSLTRLATRLLFLVAGFGYSCWAPLVPFVKHQLGIADHILGMLFLCIGCGSIAAMAVTGVLAMRFGSKPIILGVCANLVAAPGSVRTSADRSH